MDIKKAREIVNKVDVILKEEDERERLSELQEDTLISILIN